MMNTTATRRKFTRLAFTLAIAAGVAAAIWTMSAIDVAAQSEAACSNHVLRGDYGLLASGIRQVPPLFGTGLEQFNATAMWTFDGDGTFSQGTGAFIHGEVAPVDGPSTSEFEGTYSVNPNCTGTMALFVPGLPFPIQYGIVIVDHGREIKGITIAPSTSLATVSLTQK